MGNLLELWELEHLDLHTVQKDGKRFIHTMVMKTFTIQV